jgi:hypothetical protein
MLNDIVETASVHKSPYSPENTVVITGLHEEPNENLGEKVKGLVRAMELELVKVVNCMRLSSKIRSKPGLVKVEVENESQKIDLLRAKRKLQDYPAFSRVFIRGSRTYAERTMERNTRLLLKNMPEGHLYRITSSGKLVLKNELVEGRENRKGAEHLQKSSANKTRMEHGNDKGKEGSTIGENDSE